MNLDDVKLFSDIDTQNMLAEIDSLPDQLIYAWQLAQSNSLPEWKNIQWIVLSGMGGSAIGADILAEYVSSTVDIPIFVNRDYGIPGWAKGSETLIIASSHSGNTEETLSAFEKAVTRGCRVLVVTTGGKLADQARITGIPIWHFNHQGQPRSAVGYSFCLLYGALYQLGILPDISRELRITYDALRLQQSYLTAGIPVVRNPAKRQAGQLFGRISTIVGSGILTPIARRIKGQISEISKSWSQFEVIPEMAHNTLAGTVFPEGMLQQLMVLFLRSPSDHPRNRLRTDLIRRIFMLRGLGTDVYDAQGDIPLANIFTTLHYGDYLAYYLAMAYEVDPSPVEAIEDLKSQMKRGM